MNGLPAYPAWGDDYRATIGERRCPSHDPTAIGGVKTDPDGTRPGWAGSGCPGGKGVHECRQRFCLARLLQPESVDPPPGGLGGSRYVEFPVEDDGACFVGLLVRAARGTQPVVQSGSQQGAPSSATKAASSRLNLPLERSRPRSRKAQHTPSATRGARRSSPAPAGPSSSRQSGSDSRSPAVAALNTVTAVCALLLAPLPKPGSIGSQ
jgi:hypothetical protein